MIFFFSLAKHVCLSAFFLWHRCLVDTTRGGEAGALSEGLHPPRSPEEVLGRVDPIAPVLLRHWEHTPGLCPKWEVLCRKSSTLRVTDLLIALTSSWTFFILNFFFVLFFLIVKRLMHLQDLNGKTLGVVSPVPQHKLQSLSHQQVKGSLAWCGSCISRSWSRFEWKLWSLEPVAGQSQEDLP